MDDAPAGVTGDQFAPAPRSIRYALTEDAAGPSLGIRGPAEDGTYEVSLDHAWARCDPRRLEAALTYLLGRLWLDAQTGGEAPPVPPKGDGHPA